MKYLYKPESYSIPQSLLFIPLKETVIFPYVIAPLFFRTDEALALLNKVISENSLIGCVGQRDPHLKDPQPKDLLSVGTVCKVLQLVKLPNKGVKIFVEGLSRVLLQNIIHEAPYFNADIKEVNEHQERTVLSETLVATAVLSLLKGRPVPHEIAMTGELTLSGRVLPVGGIKEKILAARRAGVKTVILPKKNEENLDDISEDVKKEIHLVMVEHIQEVFDLALPS